VTLYTYPRPKPSGSPAVGAEMHRSVYRVKSVSPYVTKMGQKVKPKYIFRAMTIAPATGIIAALGDIIEGAFVSTILHLVNQQD
jgi:hypothetical protein